MARPSSSPSESLLGGLFARGDAAAAAGEEVLLPTLLEVEAALARACAREGLIPGEAAEAIAAACADVPRFDAAALAAEAARHAQPVVGLVAALREAVGPAAAPHVHHGATSQDVLDTALMLVAARSLDALVADLGAGAGAAADLVRAHDDTPQLGRTLLQPALPTTFGATAGAWRSGLAEAAAGLQRVRREVLAVQLGGPVGDLDAPALVAAFADELGIVAPERSWHGDRRRPAELASALGIAAGAAAKVAGDVVLLAQAEVGEVREGGPGGGSSSMPHKRNPVAAVSTLACAHAVPSLVAAQLAAMPGELQRAAGRWQAEWPLQLQLLRLTGSAVAWTTELLGGLEVDAERMATNLEAAGIPK